MEPRVRPDDLEVSTIDPIRVWDDSLPGVWMLPSISHTQAIPTLWEVLHLLDSDWLEAAATQSAPSSVAAHGDGRVPSMLWAIDALDALRPRYVLSLFSYIHFFFLLERGLQTLLRELLKTAGELGLNIKKPKSPKRTDYIKKLRLVRNNTLVHWGERGDLDSIAGKRWGFAWPSECIDLTHLQFGGESVRGASDRQLDSLPETHSQCKAYLQRYDVACAAVLRTIHARLPRTIGPRRYEVVEGFPLTRRTAASGARDAE